MKGHTAANQNARFYEDTISHNPLLHFSSQPTAKFYDLKIKIYQQNTTTTTTNYSNNNKSNCHIFGSII